MGRARVPNWVWAVLVTAHVLTMAWALHSGRWNFPDSGRYRQAAANLVEHGQLYARPWPSGPPRGQAVQEFTIRPPAYPVVLAALGSTTGTLWLVLLVQNALEKRIQEPALQSNARALAVPVGPTSAAPYPMRAGSAHFAPAAPATKYL